MMKNSFLIHKWTETLEELFSSGVSLKDSLSIMKDLRGLSKEERNLSQEILFSLDCGMNFSESLKESKTALFPKWYTGIIAVCEESGNMEETFQFLKQSLARKFQLIQKTAFTCAYPLFLMTGTLLFAFYMKEVFNSTGFSSCLLFLLSANMLYFIIVKHFFNEKEILIFLKASDFLWNKKIPLQQILETASVCISEKKLLDSIKKTINGILDGRDVANMFEKNLREAGYEKEGKIISQNLSLSLAGSKESPFGKAFQTINTLVERNQEMFFKIQNTLLLLIAAIGILLAAGNLNFLTYSMGGII